MGVFKNDVGRPSNKTITIRNILKGVLLIIIAASIFAGGYALNGYQKKEDSGTKEKNIDKVDNNSSEKISNKEAQEVFDKYNLYTDWLDLVDNPILLESRTENKKKLLSNAFSYFYDQDVTNKTISDTMKFAVSMGNLYIKEETGKTAYGEKYKYKIFDFEGQKELNFDIINKKSIELFDSKVDINNIIDKNNNIVVTILGTSFKYNSVSKKIVPNEDGGLGDSSSIDYYTKIINTKVLGDKLEITNKVMFVICSAPEDYCYISKTNQDINNIKNVLTKIDKSNLENLSIENYLDKLDSYKWTFTKNDEGNYVFKSIEKVK